MATYFGGSSTDIVTDVAVDASGNIYITGYTNSTDFPTTPDAFDPTFNGVPVEYTMDTWISIPDAFLAKFTRTGTLVFSTFFGGTSIDTGRSIALDPSGNAYITGWTWSSDFPITEDAFDMSLAADADGIGADAFVAKFDPEGALLYSTFLGGKGADFGRAIAVDSLGNVYVTGRTGSRDFPIRGGIVQRGTHVDDVFVAKLNPDGTGLEYSTVIGGLNVDFAWSVAVDARGSAYVAGWTYSSDFPVTPGAFDTSMEYPEDPWRTAFLFKLDPDATALEYSTFVGGSSGNDEIRAVVVDSAGNAYVTGVTESLEFPTSPGAFDATPGPEACCDAFVAKLDPSGSTLLYSTFLGGTKPAVGGTGYDEGNGIFVDESGQAYVIGATDSVDFPTSSGAYDATYNGESWRDQDAFVAKLDPDGRALNYSTFLGGGDDVLYVETQPDRDLCSQYCGDLGYSLAIDSTGNTTVVGTTNALDFPVTEGAYDPTFNGGRFDVFIVRMELIPEPNRVPVAYFEATSSPEAPGRVDVDAAGSADAEDPTSELEVRWDWEDDGAWDTEWSTNKEASHEYAAPGTYTIRLEVRDTGGLAGSVARGVTVPGQVWGRLFGSSATDEAWGIAVGPSGVYVAGGTLGALPGQTYLGGLDAFVRKYDASGNELWTRQFGNSSHESARAIAVDASAVYVAGFTDGILPGRVSAGGPDVFLRQYDPQGNEVWTRQFGSSGIEEPRGIAVDASGVYVAGYTDGALAGRVGAGNFDVFVRKYDVDGNELWTRQFGNSLNQFAEGIVVDPSGVYVAGWTDETLPGQVNAGFSDAFLRKYDADGNELWTRQFGSPGPDSAFGIARDPSGVYAAGRVQGALPGQTYLGALDAFVRKYDASGNELWTRQFGTSGIEEAGSIAVDPSGVYVAYGYTVSSYEFLRKYDADGNELWTRQFGSGLIGSIAVDPSGVYVAGVMYSDVFVAKLTPQSADLPLLFSVPGPMIVEARGPSGATVDYVVTAEDDTDGSITPVCSPSSGSTFPLGTTTVTCTATDSSGSTASASFTVTVQDITAPTLTVPADLTVEATGSAGAVVTYQVTATDLVDPSPLVTCSPTSGSTFDLGATTVTCTATDFAGNNAIASFRVTVTDGGIGPSGLNLGPIEVAAIVVAFGAAATAVVALMRRKRKGRDPKDDKGGASQRGS